MNLLPDLHQLRELVCQIAQQEIMPRYAAHVKRIAASKKMDQSVLTEVDLAMQQALQQNLNLNWPGVRFLGEEMPEAQQQALLDFSEQGLWVVDPIDGTSNFSLGIPFFSVSLALIVDAKVKLAVVYDPARDECFYAEHGKGAYLNDIELTLKDVQDVTSMTTALVDFKRLPAQLATRLATNPPYKSQRSFGSVALDWCWIAAGRGDVYVHGKQNLWDYVAGALILHEAGGFNSTLNGEPVYNGTLQPRSAVLAINETIYKKWYAFLSESNTL